MTLPEEHWYWLSFADAELPAGQQFLGGCLISSWSTIGAIKKTHALGINPGGEVQILEMPTGDHPPEGWPREQLLSREDIERLEAQTEERSS